MFHFYFNLVFETNPLVSIFQADSAVLKKFLLFLLCVHNYLGTLIFDILLSGEKMIFFISEIREPVPACVNEQTEFDSKITYLFRSSHDTLAINYSSH